MNGAVTPGRMGLVCIWACAATAAMAASPNDEPVPSDASPPLLSLTQLDGYLEFEAEYDRTRVRSDAGQRQYRLDQSNSHWGFEERIGLQLGGYVVDPNWLSFSADLGFALTQERYEEHTATRTLIDNDTGYLDTFDVRLDLFTGEPLSGSIYARRYEDRVNRRFQPTLTERRTEAGVSWSYAHDTFPVDLSYDYRKVDRVGNVRDLDDEHYMESVWHLGGAWRIDDHHELDYSYEHSEDQRTYQGLGQEFDTHRDLLRLDHQLRLGADDQHLLQTILHWQEESGDFARDLLEIGPQLTLQHTDNLQTSYRYQFNREQYDGLQVDSHRGDLQLVHQAYRNLTTTVDLFGLHEQSQDDVDVMQYGGSVDWQYNRANPWGRLYANLAIGADTEDVYGDDRERLIRNESHTLRDPVSANLRNRNVVPGSVVVTDVTDRRVYTLGVDYFLIDLGDTTRLTRIASGRITDGDTILVDYKYRTPENGTTNTVRTDFSIEQRFDMGLTPYYRFAFREQDVDASTGYARHTDRTDHHRLGLTYDSDRYRLGGEFEIFDDRIEPYDAFHVDAAWHVLQRGPHAVEAGGRLSRFFFEGGRAKYNVTLVDCRLDHRWRLDRRWSTVERLGFRWEDDDLDGYKRGWDASAGLQYEMGELSAELTVEYDRLSLPESIESDFGAYLRVRRDLPGLLGVAR